MKVTAEMVKRAQSVRRLEWNDMKDVLEAALADVPEPGVKEQGPFVLSGEECRLVDAFAKDPDTGYVTVLAKALDRAVRTLAPVQEPGPFVLSRLEKIALHDQVVCAGAQGTLQKALDRACRTLGPREAPAPTATLTTSRESEALGNILDAVCDSESINEADYIITCGLAQRLRAAPAPTGESAALQELDYLVDELEGEQDASVIWHKVNDRICKLRRAAPAPTGDVLTAEEREQVEALRSTVVIPGSTKARVIAVVDRIAPKTKPVEKTNEELARELREGDQGGDSWNEKLDLLVRRANGAGK